MNPVFYNQGKGTPMRAITKAFLTTSAALFISIPAASAQDASEEASETTAAAEGTADSTAGGEVISLPDWHPEINAQNAMSIEDILGMDVYGPTDEEIGDVENILLGTDGQVLSVIAEVGGVWDIGDTHVNVPWSDVDIDPAAERVVLPVTQETVEDYTLFTEEVITANEAATETTEVEGDSAGLVDTGPRVWQARELIGDYARLTGDGSYVNYGYVDDIVIQNGKVSAVVVRPDVTWGSGGLYAYPYYGYSYGWTPGLPYYDLPYARADVEGMEPLDDGIWDD